MSDLAGTLAAFATFAIGFIARPLGGVAMGHYGDRLGRKSMLVWSLMLMGLSTLGIGLLPNYAQLGVWAPVLLVTFRFVQGFALGGEWGGAVLMSVEHAPQARRGFFGSFVALGLPAGIILSNLVFLITSSAVSPAAFAEWAWRIPFIASAVLVAVGLWVRVGLAESPIFAQILEDQAARRMPIVDVLRHDARAVALAAGSYIGISTLGYIVIVYFVSYATRELKFPLTTTLALLLTAAVMFAGSIFAFAVWSDRFGRRRIMQWGNGALVLWSLVFFPLADTRIRSAGRARAVRDTRHPGRVHRPAASGVLGALSHRDALQRRLTQPDARNDSRRRALARDRGLPLQRERELHAHHRLHHGDVVHLVAGDAGV